MKSLITLLFVLVAAGCSKTEVETKSDIEKLEAENKNLEAELKEEKRKSDAAATEARAAFAERKKNENVG